MRSEAEISKQVMMEASRLGLRVFRNQVGQYKLADKRTIRSGLCVGSSDLIGWMPCGKFAAIEVKSPKGRPTQAQINFIDKVKEAGGFGCIINDEKKLKKLVDEFYNNV